ncbi:ATP-binding cassette domain-containing protein [Streptomyces sp. CNQ085]|uniref:ATP-binding cassette domain-containing protein n=1 Tax=Streptomyces sp. CNQ085 TaxID=2886944 RepID=UPI001F5109A2|nr:ATP-binding cassette domain-containing protein [Streptomyces sp. CNQ085]MCI0385926.1 ATP-binding cassette domain-containing protein [Streptomyces sp. CNQ085]
MSPAGRTSPGPARRLLPHAARFLSRRRRVLLRLGGWSLLESGQTFLVGYGVAQALDRGFLAGRTGTGLAWLAVAAAATVAGGLAVRGVFRGLADLVEPLRDGLLSRVVARALHGAVAEPARTDSSSVSRLTHQTELARDSFAGLVLVLRSFVFTAAGALAGLASLHLLLLLVVLPPLVLGLLLFTATLVPMAARQRDFLDADEALSMRYGAVAAGLRDVVACGAERPTAREADALVATEVEAARSLARWAAARTVALGVAGHLPIVLLLLATPWLLDRGLTAGALLGALTYLTQSLLPALRTLMSALGAAGTRLLVILDRLVGAEPGREGEPEAGKPAAAPAEPSAPAGPSAPASSAEGSRVELRSVTFAYGPGAQPVLWEVDLTVEPGEHLVVVGPSGIGKSTLTALVAGLLTPGRGEVLVDGVPPPAAGRGAGEPARRRVLIPQQAYVFTGTLRENLLYLCPDGPSGGGPESGGPEARLAASVAAVGLGPLAASLGGLDAVIDPAALSHGERQLIALARAHLSPAPLVLLDEATCHLDPEAEERAERAFADRPGTLVVVAHRISSAHRADRVLVMDGARATAGSHHELLESSPLYRDLVGRWHTGREARPAARPGRESAPA